MVIIAINRAIFLCFFPSENVSASIPTTFYGSPSVPTTNIAPTPATLDAVVCVKAAYETGMVDKIKQVTFLTLE